MTNRRKVFARPGAAHRGRRWVTETITSTGTWTRPYGVDRVRVLCVSGGGSGASGTTYGGSPSGGSYGGGGGGAGGLVDVWVDVSAIASLTVTIGGAAGNTSFGTLVKTWRGGGSTMMDSYPTTYQTTLHGGSGASAYGFYASAGLGANGQGSNGSGTTGHGGGGATAAASSTTGGTGYTAWNGTVYATGGKGSQSSPSTATANTGNGGDGGAAGGSGEVPPTQSGKTGASGVVLVGYWV